MIKFYISATIISIFSFAGHIFFRRRMRRVYFQKQHALEKKYNKANSAYRRLEAKISSGEAKINELFFIYDLIKKIDSVLDEQVLFDISLDAFKRLEGVSDALIVNLPSSKPLDNGWREFKFDEDHKALRVKAAGAGVLDYLPYFSVILGLYCQRIHLYSQLQRMSIYDSLTQIYNRRYFMMRYREEFSRAKKYNLNLSLFMIDIDHFKKINDDYGHLVGDVVLRAVAGVVKNSMREIDFIGRLGGEEFAVVLSDTDRKGAFLLAQRVCTRMAQTSVSAFDEWVKVTVSVGLASYPGDGGCIDSLLESADKALYRAKSYGRNQVATNPTS